MWYTIGCYIFFITKADGSETVTLTIRYNLLTLVNVLNNLNNTFVSIFLLWKNVFYFKLFPVKL